jgi:hypothetical protein
MSTLQNLVNNFTNYQAICMIPVFIFTILEIKKWNKFKEINQNFVFFFIFRCIVMIGVFIIARPVFAILISSMSIVCVSISGGSFYLPGPKDKQQHEWVKYKTLNMTIPRETIGQICLWFIIDVFSYLFWVIVLALGISEFFSDSMFKILFERLL